MAFMDKLGKVANKVGEMAGDTLDYGKAKGKILLEKGKVNDAEEALGTYVYETRKNGGALDESRLADFCSEIDKHLAEIEKLQAEAKKSGEDIGDAFDSVKGSVAAAVSAEEAPEEPEENKEEQ